MIPSSKNNLFVWHRVPPHMRGKEIVSLSGLRVLHPELAAWEEKKYAGRETLMQQYVPPLDCIWNDIIFFAPYHPQIMFDAYKAAGFTPPPMRFYQIPVERLLNYTLTWWLPPTKPMEMRYTPFHVEDLPIAFPEEQKQAYLNAYAQGIKPLLYARSPHLCLAAPVKHGTPISLNIEGVEIVEID